VGSKEGLFVGDRVGFVVGIAEGSPGVFVGERVGVEVGIADGNGVTPAGATVGANISSIAFSVFRQTKSTGASLLRSIAALLPTQQVSSPVVSKQ
jgi:hypothetical protein